MKDTGARLTRDTVLRAALELLDEVGIDGLSTRKLAERLGVQSPTLYWHFKNKGELLDAMAEAIMLERHCRGRAKRGMRGFWTTRAVSVARCWPIATARACMPVRGRGRCISARSNARSRCSATRVSRRTRRST